MNTITCTSDIHLLPISVNVDYLKMWNESSRDFVMLTKNGEPLNNSLYRVGGMGGYKKDSYFIILKYVEALYDIDFIKGIYPKKNIKEQEKQRRHLESRWVIIDKFGMEKKEFKLLDSPYLVSNQKEV